MSDNRETNTLTANDGWSNQKEITIRFSKKLADGPFEAKDGKSYVQVSIPNKDPEDKSPWASFILRAEQVHDNSDGTRQWAAIPADGITTLQRDVKTDAVNAEGKNIYRTQYRKVSNQELKKMVESYRNRGREETSPKEAKTEGEKTKETVREPKKESEMTKRSGKDVKGKAREARDSVLGKLSVAKEAVSKKMQAMEGEIPLAKAVGAR